MSNLFIDDYFASLYTGEQKTAQSLLDDVNLNSPDESLANVVSLPITYMRKLINVTPDSPVLSRTLEGNHQRTVSAITSFYDTAQKTIELQDASDRLYSSSLTNVERSLDQLRMEIETWENQLFNRANFSNIVRKSFLPNGITISQGGKVSLSVSSVSVRVNAPLDVPFESTNTGKNINISVSSISSINNPLFIEGYGLQAEITLDYEPGQANNIGLSPVSLGGAAPILHSIKVFPIAGEPIVVATGLTLNKSYQLTFPKMVVNKVVLEVLQENFNITTIKIPKTVTEEVTTVTPGKSTRVNNDMPLWLKGVFKHLINVGSNAPKISTHPSKMTVEQIANAFPGAVANPSKTTAGILKSPAHVRLLNEAINVYSNGSSKRTVVSPPITTVSTVTKTIFEEESRYVYSIGFSDISLINFYNEETVVENRIRFKLNGSPTLVTLRASDWIPEYTSVEYSVRTAGSYNWIPVPNADDDEYIQEILYPDYRGFCILRFPFTTKNGLVPQVYEGTRLIEPTEYLTMSNQVFQLKGTITSQIPYYIKYEPEQKENIVVSYGDAVSAYQDANGELGETFQSANADRTITLTEYPYIDRERLESDGYNPVAILIPGRSTQNITNWSGGPEDSFARTPDKDNIMYKVRGKQIIFDQDVLLPITVVYEYLKSYIDLRIIFKTFNTPANSPVVYGVQLSALERT